MARRPKLTDAERAQRRAADRERLKQAAEQLLTSDGWQRWVRLRSRAGLARLSLLSRGGYVNVAVPVRSDVDDMSLMEGVAAASVQGGSPWLIVAIDVRHTRTIDIAGRRAV